MLRDSHDIHGLASGNKILDSSEDATMCRVVEIVCCYSVHNFIPCVVVEHKGAQDRAFCFDTVWWEIAKEWHTDILSMLNG